MAALLGPSEIDVTYGKVWATADCVSGGRTSMTEREDEQQQAGMFLLFPSPGWAWLGLFSERGKGELLRKS